MERTANIDLAAWRASGASPALGRRLSIRIFAGVLMLCACSAALFASWLPLQISVVTVFLFAGPHNWFELRYFLMRLPLRFGKSRTFFLTAFAGIGFLSLAYIALPVLNSFGLLPDHAWPTVLASWNTLLLLWIGVLVWLRGKNKLRRDWSWAIPVAMGLCSLNWLAPEFFSLGIVYLHPLVALWFLDRHLGRRRPEWLRTYRRCLCLLPLLITGMFWQLTRTPALPDDNGLFWRITQHAGAQLLPNISSQVLVATHVFLEMLHYGVWLVALPLIAPLARQTSEPQPSAAYQSRRIWNLKTIPLARHPRGFPKLIATALAFGVFLVLVLWFGFSVDYATTRDVYFTIAIAHVLAEAPFLLKML
ncbi:MAG TPA: hypothetical protein VGN90_04695 [Pyrinomonadaceae bacterium]|nr:hypothetical protein [Pyrinomonadaceae bacterium]